MKKINYLLCALLILSGCAPKNEPKENEQNKVVVTTQPDSDDKIEAAEKETEKEVVEKADTDDQVDLPNDIPVEPEDTSSSDIPVDDENTKVESEIDLEALSAAIQKTDIFSMNMQLDHQQIADLYGNIGTDQFETAIVLKNMISPGGDEAAIFKVKEGQMDAVKAGIQARDAYGKNEGSFYEMEQEMFNTSKIIEFNDIIVYIAARNVDEVVDIVNQTLK